MGKIRALESTKLEQLYDHTLLETLFSFSLFPQQQRSRDEEDFPSSSHLLPRNLRDHRNNNTPLPQIGSPRLDRPSIVLDVRDVGSH